jgi:hypothetical protein
LGGHGLNERRQAALREVMQLQGERGLIRRLGRMEKRSVCDILVSYKVQAETIRSRLSLGGAQSGRTQSCQII